MQDAFHALLSIQELDVKMVRLMQLKEQRRKELKKLFSLQKDVAKQVSEKEEQIKSLKLEIRAGEVQIKEIESRVSQLEAQQAAVKKMDEFNALTQELTQFGRDRHATEQKLSELTDQLASEEDLLVALKENCKNEEANGRALEKEIVEAVETINQEGKELLKAREEQSAHVDPDLLAIYERLLKNKKDRVVVPIENRTCGGCHIVLTPQHENQVRQADRIVFCEHCSRVLYWPETVSEMEEEGAASRRRRRRASSPSA